REVCPPSSAFRLGRKSLMHPMNDWRCARPTETWFLETALVSKTAVTSWVDGASSAGRLQCCACQARCEQRGLLRTVARRLRTLAGSQHPPMRPLDLPRGPPPPPLLIFKILEVLEKMLTLLVGVARKIFVCPPGSVGGRDLGGGHRHDLFVGARLVLHEE